MITSRWMLTTVQPQHHLMVTHVESQPSSIQRAGAPLWSSCGITGGRKLGGCSCLRLDFRFDAGLTAVCNHSIWRNDHGVRQCPTMRCESGGPGGSEVVDSDGLHGGRLQRCKQDTNNNRIAGKSTAARVGIQGPLDRVGEYEYTGPVRAVLTRSLRGARRNGHAGA